MKSLIHVNQHNIRANKRDKGRRPIFTVKDYLTNRKGNHVTISGPCKLVYQPERPLKCGAHAWIETESRVTVR